MVILQRGIDLPSRDRVAGEVPVLGSFGITGWHNVAAVAGPGVAIGRSGASIGVATYSPGDYWPLNTALYSKDLRGNNARYVYYLLKSIDFKAYNSGSAQPSLNRNYIGHLPVELPPVLEQRAIAEVLGALDDKIEANGHAATVCESLAVAHLQAVPIRRSVGTFVTTSREQLKPEQFADQLVEHFSLPAFDEGRVPERCAGTAIKSNKFRVNRPSVLVSKLNPHIPRVWYADPAPGQVALASTEFVVLEPRDACSPAVLWAACAAPEFASAVAERVTGTTGSHQRVKPQDVLDTAAPDVTVLPKSEHEVVDGLVLRALVARRESEVLARLRDVLLPPLISGELRVHDAEALVGEAV